MPKDKGPAHYLGALVVKAMVKHGWPARLGKVEGDSFQVESVHHGRDLPSDFADALDMAVRITARSYRVEVENYLGEVTLLLPYVVTEGGHFREVKP